MVRMIAASALLMASAALAQPVGTAWVYQGDLHHGGVPAVGAHDMQFRLFTDPVAGVAVGPTLCANDVVPAGGKFSVTLDFGAVFDGQKRYLQVAVRTDVGTPCSDVSGYTTLAGRQELTTTPYANFALVAASAQQLNGQGAGFYTDASNLSSGTIADARLATTIARTNTTQTFTGAMTFTNPASSYAGSGSLLTNLDAAALGSGLVPDARLPSTLARTNVANIFTTDQTINGGVLINAPTALATLHVGGEGYFTGAVRLGHTTSPRAGVIRFNSSTRDFEGYNGAWWRSLTSGATIGPSTVLTYSTPGGHSFIVPEGVVSIGIEAWGGGGGGGGSGLSLTDNCANNQATGGGGGGAGGYSMTIIDVIPGDTITVTVGNGGNGGSGGTPGVAGGTTTVLRNGTPVVQGTGDGFGNAGSSEPIGSDNCASLSSFATGGAPGVGSLGNFSNQPGGGGTPGRRAWNDGGCGLPPPDMQAGCAGSAGTAVSSVSPNATFAGQGGIGGVHSGTSGGPGQNGAFGRVRILY